MSAEDEAKARALLLTVARVVGPTVTRGERLSIGTSYFEVGGNSLNSVLTVTSLQDLGYNIGKLNQLQTSLPYLCYVELAI